MHDTRFHTMWCGYDGQVCCDDEGYGFGKDGCATGECDLGTCRECGHLGIVCCHNDKCDNDLGCIGDTCQECGYYGEQCCPGDKCIEENTVCVGGEECLQCGYEGDPCCDDDTCNSGLECDGDECIEEVDLCGVPFISEGECLKDPDDACGYEQYNIPIGSAKSITFLVKTYDHADDIAISYEGSIETTGCLATNNVEEGYIGNTGWYSNGNGLLWIQIDTDGEDRYVDVGVVENCYGEVDSIWYFEVACISNPV